MKKTERTKFLLFRNVIFVSKTLKFFYFYLPIMLSLRSVKLSSKNVPNFFSSHFVHTFDMWNFLPAKKRRQIEWLTSWIAIFKELLKHLLTNIWNLRAHLCVLFFGSPSRGHLDIANIWNVTDSERQSEESFKLADVSFFSFIAKIKLIGFVQAIAVTSVNKIISRWT